MIYLIPDEGRSDGVSVWTVGLGIAGYSDTPIVRIRGRAPYVGMTLRVPPRTGVSPIKVKLTAVRNVVDRRFDAVASSQVVHD